ncbi:pilus assembly FimT family protein [Cerasicoccus frondis]|uniref:pilus assembly FimT family protein n=1 Tax=Cerasicoccus frondis TaxID=490090 RepID=UPI0028529348|nr:prepilin-type N-terminal cleavage/methylation domain-containing protein [Cerasicoccus frondis]
MSPAKRRRAGLSLIEIMIGMAILGLVMAASLMAIPEIRELNFRSDSVRSGYTVLNSELENLRTQTYDQLSDTITNSGSSPSGGLLGGLLGLEEENDQVQTKSTVTLNSTAYTVVRDLQFMDSAKEIIQTTITVDWSSAGRSQNIVGRAIFTKDGLSDKKFSTAN